MPRWMTFLAAGLLACGCTPGEYARQADQAAYSTLKSGQHAALGADKPFDATYGPLVPTGAPATSQPASQPSTQPDPSVIRVGEREIPVGAERSIPLPLEDALEIAFRNSRSFQTRKEQLYSQALALANQRRSWTWPQLGGDAAAEGSWSATGKAGQTVKSSTASLGPTLTRRLANGGVLALAATLDFATDFLGSGGTTVGSLLEANLTQPLLQGAWRDLAYETLYRAERDFIFAVFDYERFTQTFAAGIVTKYYTVLQQRDQLENEQANIDRLKETFALTRVLVEGGQVSPIQQDQAEQNLLNAQVRYQRDQQGYRDALDQLKLALGLPVAAGIEPDYPGELDRLNAGGPQALAFEEAPAIQVALAVRPDVLTERAKVRDAERNVEIAADKFLPQLDLELAAGVSGADARDFWQVEFDRHTRTASLTFNYSLDQTDNRDAYRNTLIALDKARRDFAQFADGVRLEVRQSYRSLLQSRRSYEIQKRNVDIARRRRKLASLQQKEGEASARDVLEAEEDLRSAQNGLTAALVSYTTTRMEFLASLGMLEVNEKGRIHERAEPSTFERIARQYPYVSGR